LGGFPAAMEIEDGFTSGKPQGLKPAHILGLCGTTKVVPFHDVLKLTVSN